MSETMDQPVTRPTESPDWRFVISILHYLPASVLPGVFAIGATTVFTRIFPPSDYGIYSLVLAVSSLLVPILTEWAAQPIGRFYAEYEHQNRGEEFRRMVAAITLLVAAAVVLLIVLGLAVLIVANGALTQPFVLTGAAAVVLTQSLTSVVRPILPASLQPVPYRRTIVATSGLSFGLSLALIYLFNANIAWLLWGQALASAILLPYVYRSANIRLSEFALWWTPQMSSTFRRFWHYGGPLMLWMLASSLLNAGDRYVIQLFQGSTAVGIYSVNYNLTAMAFGLINGPIITAAAPILMRQWAHRDDKAVRRTLTQMTRIYLVIGLGLVGGVAVIDQPLVDVLLGAEFRSGYILHLPVAAGMVLWGLSTLGQKSMEFSERTTLMVWDIFIAAGANLVLNFALIPRFGYVAAAYTTLASYGVYVVLIWWQARRLVPWDLPYLSIVQISLAALVSWVIGEAAMRITDSAILKLVVGAVGFICTYGLVNLTLFRREMRLVPLFRMGR